MANRESVDSSKWNDNILAAVYHAFVYKAVPCFHAIQTVSAPNEASGGLRYTWPLYLKGGGEMQSFWSQLNRRIFSGLTTLEVLESRHSGQLCRPETLYYIPANYRFQGEPLIEDATSNSRHLSFAYDTDDIDFLPILENMGVKIFTIHYLVQALRDAIAKNGITYLENQSLQWHSKIANLLHYGISYSHLLDLPLIPLRDGR